MYTLQDVPGKGKGLVAREDIRKGTRILMERPVITVPERQQSDEWLKTELSQQFKALDDQQKSSLLSLHNLYPYNDEAEQVLGIYRTNGLPIKAEGTGGGVFLEACMCSLSTADSQKDDWRLERIDHLDDLIGRECNSMKFSQQALGYVDERIQLYNSWRPGNSGLARAYFDAAQIAIANSDLSRGRVFADRAIQGWRTAHGNDCEEVITYAPLARDSSKFPMYGMSGKWPPRSGEAKLPPG